MAATPATAPIAAEAPVERAGFEAGVEDVVEPGGG